MSSSNTLPDAQSSATQSRIAPPTPISGAASHLRVQTLRKNTSFAKSPSFRLELRVDAFTLKEEEEKEQSIPSS